MWREILKPCVCVCPPRRHDGYGERIGAVGRRPTSALIAEMSALPAALGFAALLCDRCFQGDLGIYNIWARDNPRQALSHYLYSFSVCHRQSDDAELRGGRRVRARRGPLCPDSCFPTAGLWLPFPPKETSVGERVEPRQMFILNNVAIDGRGGVWEVGNQEGVPVSPSLWTDLESDPVAVLADQVLELFSFAHICSETRMRKTGTWHVLSTVPCISLSHRPISSF